MGSEILIVLALFAYEPALYRMIAALALIIEYKWLSLGVLLLCVYAMTLAGWSLPNVGPVARVLLAQALLMAIAELHIRLHPKGKSE